MRSILSRDDYERLFRGLPGLYLLLTPDLTIVEASDAYLEATMTTRKGMIGRYIFDIFPSNPDAPNTSQRNLQESFTRVLKFKVPDAMPVTKYDIRKPEVRGGGFEERFWSPVNSPLLNEKGEVIYIVHRVEDVTEYIRLQEQGEELKGQAERMQAEIFLRAQEVAETNATLKIAQNELQALYEDTKQQNALRLSAIMDNTAEGLITISDKGIIETYNKACERIFGYKAEETIGKNVKMLMPENTAVQHDGYIDRYKKTGEGRIIGTVGREVEGQKKDGTRFPLELSINSITIGERRIFSGILRDISERKDAASYLKTVMNTIIDGIIVIDNKGIIQTINPACIRLFGYGPEEVVGQNVKMLMPEPYHSQHDGYLHNYLKTGEAKVIGIGREVSAQRKDGTVFPMELGINEMRIGAQRMFVGTIRDITERKLAEHKLHEALTELQLSNQDLETFTYIASHDLRSPLVNLRGFSGELHRSIDTIIPMLENVLPNLSEVDQEILHRETCRMMPKALQYIISSAEKMDRLTSAILKLSRLGRTVTQNETISTNTLVKECLGAMRHQIEQTRSIVEVDELPDIFGDRTAIEQVFGNLLDNALKYLDLKRPGHIHIKAKPGFTHTVFSVQDNGRGIASDDLHKVFEIFRRAGDVESIPGEGMGMAYVRAIVKRHGGDIWCESTQGEGTTFHFTIANHNSNRKVA
jgi:two-component system sensor kinase FixL